MFKNNVVLCTFVYIMTGSRHKIRVGQKTILQYIYRRLHNIAVRRTPLLIIPSTFNVLPCPTYIKRCLKVGIIVALLHVVK